MKMKIILAELYDINEDVISGNEHNECFDLML